MPIYKFFVSNKGGFEIYIAPTNKGTFEIAPQFKGHI